MTSQLFKLKINKKEIQGDGNKPQKSDIILSRSRRTANAGQLHLPGKHHVQRC